MCIKKTYLLCPIILISLFVNSLLLAQNIVTNSDFEIGKIGELPDEWQDQKEDGAEGNVFLTDKESHNGKQSLFIENTNDEGYIHPNKSVKISPGDYIFSFWAKSDKDIEFPAQIYNEADWNILFDTSCSLKSNLWTKFEFPLSFTEEFTGSIQIGLTSQGHLWLDDVELTKKTEIKQIPQNIKIWDTMTKKRDIGLETQDKSKWRLLSDDVSNIKGDLAIENNFFIIIFCSELGDVVIYSKSGQKRAEIKPIRLKGKDIKLTKCSILGTMNDSIVVETHFSDEDIDFPVSFTISKKQIIGIKSAQGMGGISIYSPIEYGIVPNFISDDLIFDPKYYKETINIPSERLFLGLLNGRDSELFITLPLAHQDIRLVPDNDKKLFESIEIENDGQSIYLSLLEAPNIWHKEELKPSYLEDDVLINWKRPFPAKWVTQLYEDGVKTRYTFKATKPKDDGFWRAAVGWYTYPVWFEGEKAFIRPSKKVPPKGDAIIYFLERNGTPTSILTPVDIIKATLGPDTSENILDPQGRRNRSLTRPNCDIGTATCEVTNQIKKVFEAGKEVEKAEYIKGGTEDMIYFLARENERAMEYQDFAKKMLNFLSTAKINKPDQKQFIEKMEKITNELISAYEHEKNNLKDADYAKKIAEETVALTKQKSPDNLYKFIRLKEEWTGMGGAVDDLNRVLHTITRKLFQEAGYSCVDQTETVRLAEEIRRLAIECLRNPGGYEIWSNY
ncbi:TPA: hypothetical protein ENX78_10900 [Candidatus Poribacteria bacterium]|nr:hypothetical protein [Candidatus Poribacteria bacterium]